MELFINSMALFWALAEIWILLLLIQGIATARGKPANAPRYRLIFAGSALTLSILAFGGTTIAGQIPYFRSGLTAHFYRCAQWHFFCTLWVVLEGVIMVYIFRIYVMLKRSLPHHTERNDLSGRLSARSRIAVAVLVLSFFGFMVAYEHGTVSLMQTRSVAYQDLNRISLFYINICGIFWVIFDGAVAVIGYKIYKFLFRRNGERNAGLATVG